GHAAFLRSTVLRQHNAGNRQAAARAFGLWNKARNPRTGPLEVLDGLTARRQREAAMYLTSDADERPEPMPQAVDGESNLAKSPINAGG
ncbi:glycoside hydrolase family protein, partial [Bacillus cereus group sp. Bce039]|uniref:glycoside hydrolase family protein n=1 Tax=Bacillus cereus group sp. Bce039 TaxID=3445230 RepID=UPI003F255B04